MESVAGIPDRMAFVVIVLPLFLSIFYQVRMLLAFFVHFHFSLSTKKQPIGLNSGITGSWESMWTGKPDFQARILELVNVLK